MSFDDSVGLEGIEAILGGCVQMSCRLDEQIRYLQQQQTAVRGVFESHARARDLLIEPIAAEHSVTLDEFIRTVGRLVTRTTPHVRSVSLHMVEGSPEDGAPFDARIYSDWSPEGFRYQAGILTTNRDVQRRIRAAFQETGVDVFGGQALKDAYATQWREGEGRVLVYKEPAGVAADE